MNHISFYVEEHEYQRLKAIKGINRSWREFILQLSGIHKEAGDKE